MSTNTDRMLKNAQANLITMQTAKIAELEIVVDAQAQRIRELEEQAKVRDRAKKEAQA